MGGAMIWGTCVTALRRGLTRRQLAWGASTLLVWLAAGVLCEITALDAWIVGAAIVLTIISRPARTGDPGRLRLRDFPMVEKEILREQREMVQFQVDMATMRGWTLAMDGLNFDGNPLPGSPRYRPAGSVDDSGASPAWKG